MTEQDWWDYLDDNKDAIRDCVIGYHPSGLRTGRRDMPITALGAEIACNQVSEMIANNPKHEELPPDQRFDLYEQTRDTNEMLSLLGGAWFGVPESTDCWGIGGFREMVALLEDPPECGDWEE